LYSPNNKRKGAFARPDKKEGGQRGGGGGGGGRVSKYFNGICAGFFLLFVYICNDVGEQIIKKKGGYYLSY
jgi:hypothetical protein